MTRPGPLLAALAGLLLCAAPAAGHPLDEYVQASYITLGSDRVSVEVRLTPGVAIAARVLALIDADGDGAVSEAEGGAYARRVLRDLSLAVDGRAVPLSLAGGEYPSAAAVRGGEGTFRLRFEGASWSGERAGAAPGAHRLTYRNGHEPAPSAYLVNAYLPDEPFAITAQQRDWFQRGIRIEYTVAGGGAVPWAWLAAGLVAAAAAGGAALALTPRGGRA